MSHAVPHRRRPEAPAGPVVLADPVRARLVQLASDVLGAMAADDVPAALRPIAKFTPSKRIRLGATALTAALDTDDAFRAEVAEVVTQTAPQLADAVRRREPTPASDPVDTAVVMYLTRPPGWQRRLAEISVVWERERTERDLAADEIARLRAELADTRSQLKALRADAARVAADAGASSAAEVTRLRNLLRTRTGELRAAEAAAEEARALAAAAREQAEAVIGSHDPEVRMLRARVAELEKALETARRGARTERDVDDARLRLLLDTLTEAAAGVRRELALPAGTIKPADVIAGTPTGSPASMVRSVAGLDRLLGLPQVHVIVDGYNVTKTGYPELPLADQRRRLIAAMASLQARSGVEVTVVFDGGARPPAQPPAPRGVRVLFSAPDEIADDLIRRLVAAEPAGRPLVVVTSDQAVVADVRSDGAWAVASAILLERLARS